jgi:ABC-type nitrate/sulfonate/bicarbonate transport system substrate-binding protein
VRRPDLDRHRHILYGRADVSRDLGWGLPSAGSDDSKVRRPRSDLESADALTGTGHHPLPQGNGTDTNWTRSLEAKAPGERQKEDLMLARRCGMRVKDRTPVATIIVATALAIGLTIGVARAGAAQSALPKLVITTAVVDTQFALPNVAQLLGSFTKAGVEVEIRDGVGSTAQTTLIVSGNADLGIVGTGGAILPTAQGKPTTIIRDNYGGGIAALITTRSSSSIRQLTDLAGKTVGVNALNGSAYGTMSLLSDYVKSRKGEGFTLRALGTTPSLVAAVRSGQIDAGGGPLGFWGEGIKDGSLRIIFNAQRTADATILKRAVGGGQYYSESTFWGLTDNIKAKRATIVKFLTGIARADIWMRTHTPQQLADLLQRVPAYRSVDREVLASSWAFVRHTLNPYDGYLTAPVWKASQPLMERSSLGIDFSDPAFAYGARVDMTYLAAALKKSGLNLAHRRAVGLSVKAGAATGKVRVFNDPFNFACIQGVRVSIQRLGNDGRWHTVRTRLTADDGVYRASLPKTRGVIYRAIVPRSIPGGQHVCLATQSRRIRSS